MANIKSKWEQVSDSPARFIGSFRNEKMALASHDMIADWLKTQLGDNGVGMSRISETVEKYDADLDSFDLPASSTVVNVS
ncbi:hypothetical protein [Paraburkholderia kirstenboschensis]|uniref:Uncharacterized protein n=1 Tax=Paraburkholderia kirstenboschensis TaxID=1245436 RepID=A0ABZ0EQC4_9BURK|nr:hypothetical protein [Paraburkholderia kirstenboschensis]WOD18557.1 hypothetical protein RW095_38105 [Paraburkholderia kirstenboschensis]